MAWLPDGLGWIATGLFAASYLCQNAQRLRLTQALAASLWVAYGMMIHAWPVLAANLIVVTLALGSAWRSHTGAGYSGNRAGHPV